MTLFIMLTDNIWRACLTVVISQTKSTLIDATTTKFGDY